MPSPPGMPPSQFSLQQLVDRGSAAMGAPIAYAAKLLGRQQPKYSYAESRLSHGPVMMVQDPAQAKALMGEDFGRYMPSMDPTNVSPMSNEVRSQIMQGKKPVAIAPYQEPTYGPAGQKGTEQGVLRHESVHQYLGNTKVPLSRLDPNIKNLMVSQLDKMGYKQEDYADEVASRLASGQFQSLGLPPQQGVQVWKQWLSALSTTDPEKAKRLDMYTRDKHAAILQSGEPTPEQTAQFLPSTK